MNLIISLHEEEAPGKTLPISLTEVDLTGGKYLLAVAVGQPPLTASLVVSLSKDEIMALAAMIASLASDIEDTPGNHQA
jgi:hypothetical protein